MIDYEKVIDAILDLDFTNINNFHCEFNDKVFSKISFDFTTSSFCHFINFLENFIRSTNFNSWGYCFDKDSFSVSFSKVLVDYEEDE